MTRTPPLQADVYALARDRGEMAGELPLAALPRLAESLLSADGGMHWRIRGEVDARGRPGAVLQLEARLPMECQRCGGRVEFELRRDARFRFVADEARLGTEPDDDDEVDVIVGSQHMALVPWIEDEAILSLPLVPRHDAADPQCRTAVPLGAADGGLATEAARPNPFSVLAGLKPGSGRN